MNAESIIKSRDEAVARARELHEKKRGSSASDYAIGLEAMKRREAKQAYTDQLRERAVIANHTQGYRALEVIAKHHFQSFERASSGQADACMLYGSLLSLQRVSNILAKMIDQDYQQNLEDPSGLTTDQITDVGRMISQIDETRVLVTKAVHTLLLIKEEQENARGVLNEVLSVSQAPMLSTPDARVLAAPVVSREDLTGLANLVEGCTLVSKPGDSAA